MKKVLKSVGLIIFFFSISMLIDFAVAICVGIIYIAIEIYRETNGFSESLNENTIGLATKNASLKIMDTLLHLKIVSFGVISSIILILFKFTRLKIKDYIVMEKKRFIKYISAFFLGVFFNTVMSNILEVLSRQPSLHEDFKKYEELFQPIFNANIILQILAIGILTPILEEFMYRGLIFGQLKKILKYRIAIVLQGVLFGIFHLNLVQTTYATLFGIILGISYQKSKSILIPILIHAGVNLSSVIAGYNGYIFDIHSIIISGVIYAVIHVGLLFTVDNYESFD